MMLNMDRNRDHHLVMHFCLKHTISIAHNNTEHVWPCARKSGHNVSVSHICV